MTWANFYFVCFLVGFTLTLVAVIAGSTHLHLPHLHADHGGGASGHGTGAEVSPINFGTIAAFLTWFGGSGYLLTHYSGLWVLLGLGVATVCGLVGGTIVFWFLATVLVSPDENLDPADYEIVGVCGRLSNSIREGGTGELVFSQAGTRRVSGARSEDGTAIPKGTEVVVIRYEKGIAYVRRWDDMTAAHDTLTAQGRERGRA